MSELGGHEVYALWKGARKYGLKEVVEEIRREVVNRKDVIEKKKE